MTDVAPNRCEEPMNCPEGNFRPLGQKGGQCIHWATNNRYVNFDLFC